MCAFQILLFKIPAAVVHGNKIGLCWSISRGVFPPQSLILQTSQPYCSAKARAMLYQYRSRVYHELIFRKHHIPIKTAASRPNCPFQWESHDTCRLVFMPLIVVIISLAASSYYFGLPYDQIPFIHVYNTVHINMSHQALPTTVATNSTARPQIAGLFKYYLRWLSALDALVQFK